MEEGFAGGRWDELGDWGKGVEGKGAGVVREKAPFSGIAATAGTVEVAVAAGGKEGVTIAGGLMGEPV